MGCLGILGYVDIVEESMYSWDKILKVYFCPFHEYELLLIFSPDRNGKVCTRPMAIYSITLLFWAPQATVSELFSCRDFIGNDL